MTNEILKVIQFLHVNVPKQNKTKKEEEETDDSF